MNQSNTNGFRQDSVVDIEKKQKQQEFLSSLKDLNYVKLNSLVQQVDINYIYPDFENFNAIQILCYVFSNHEITYDNNRDQINHNENKKLDLIRCVNILLENGIDLTYKEPTDLLDVIHFSLLTWDIDTIKMILNQFRQQQISVANKDLLTSTIYCYKNVICKGKNTDDDYYDYQDDQDSTGNSPNTEYEETNEDYNTCKEIIKVLLEHNVDVNTLDEDSGIPSIYLAAKFQMKSLVNILLEENNNNIDLDCHVDPDNETARNLLIKYKLNNVSLPDSSCCTYHLLFKFILEKNTRNYIDEYCKYKEVDIIDDTRKCLLLFRAVQQGAEDIVRYMLGDINNKEEDLQCILRIACTKGFYNIVKILLRDYSISYDLNLIKYIIEKGTKSNDRNTAVDYNECLELLLKNKTIKWNYINLNKIDKEKTILQYAIERKQFKMIQILLRNGASLLINNVENTCLAMEIDPQLLQKYFDDCIDTQEEKKNISTLNKIRLQMETKTSEQYKYSINFNSILFPRNLNNKNVSEMVVFDQLSKDPNSYKNILMHPVSQVFIAMKWHKLRHIYYLDAIFYLFYAACLASYIFFPNIPLIVIVFISSVIALFWEFLQLFVFTREYLRALESWNKIILLTLCYAMIVLHIVRYENPTNITQIQACVILTSFMNFFFLMGHLPCMPSTVVTSVIMLKAVYFTFVPSFLTYLPLILAFITSFYALFPDSDYFNNYWTSIYKVILMATGEFDTNDLKLDKFPISYLILTLFVIFISIGLFNLLTGLAVSDIQKIKENAEFYAQQIIIRQITRMEKIIFKHKIINIFPWLNSISLFSDRYMRRVVKIDQKQVIILKRISSNESETDVKVMSIPLRNNIIRVLEAYKKIFTEK